MNVLDCMGQGLGEHVEDQKKQFGEDNSPGLVTVLQSRYVLICSEVKRPCFGQCLERHMFIVSKERTNNTCRRAIYLHLCACYMGLSLH